MTYHPASPAVRHAHATRQSQTAYYPTLSSLQWTSAFLNTWLPGAVFLLLTLLSPGVHAVMHPQMGRFLQRDPFGMTGLTIANFQSPEESDTQDSPQNNLESRIYPDGMSLYAGYHVMRGALDPTGKKIEAQSHVVYFGYEHLLIKITPCVQSDWEDHELFVNRDSNGHIFLTVGAGPIPLAQVREGQSKLIADFNRDGDVNTTPKTFSEEIYFGHYPIFTNQHKEKSVIEAIIKSVKNFPESIDYDLYPAVTNNGSPSGHNSNSFIVGLIKANGDLRIPAFINDNDEGRSGRFQGSRYASRWPGVHVPVPSQHY